MSKLAIIDGDFICYKVCPNSKKQEEPKTLQQTLDLVDWYIEEKIIYPTNIDEYIAYLGGIGNFRYSLSDTYKSGRSSERPPFFREVRYYLIDKWGFNVVDGIEASPNPHKKPNIGKSKATRSILHICPVYASTI